MSNKDMIHTDDLYAPVSFGGGGGGGGGGGSSVSSTCVGSNYGAISGEVCADENGQVTSTICLGVTVGPVTVTQCETTDYGNVNDGQAFPRPSNYWDGSTPNSGPQ